MDNFRIVHPEPNIYSPNYSFVFDFETQYPDEYVHEWMHRNFYISVYFTIVYLVFVYVGPICMSRRENGFRLKRTLIVWNVLLSFFSLCGALRTWPETLHVLRNFGFGDSVCMNSYATKVPLICFWNFLFTLAKLPELFDTVFVVLRKQKLIFLHWYHHATVTLFTWYAGSEPASTGRWMSSMNFSVHALMYGYYGLRAAGIQVPWRIAMLITIGQIVQMIMGTIVTFYAYYLKWSGYSCDISFITLYAGILMYVSYFVLFIHFFVGAYLKRPRNNKKIQ